MSRHNIRPQIVQPFFQVMGDPLGQPACIHKDQGRAMLANQLSHTIVDIGPDGVGRYRAYSSSALPREVSSRRCPTSMIVGQADPD